MVEIPVAYKIFVSGGQAAEQEFRRLKQELEAGNITWEQYRQQTRQVNQGLRMVQNQSSQSRRIFNAMNPEIRNLGRAMSGFSSIMRTVVTIQTALNIATLASQGSNSRLAEVQAEVAQAQREVNKAVHEFGEKSPEHEDALDRLNVAYSRLKETQDQIAQQNFSNILTAASSFAILGSHMATIITRSPRMVSALRAIGGAMWVAAGPIALVAAAVAAVGFAISLLIGHVTGKNPLVDFFRDFWPEAADAIEDFQKKWSQGVDIIARAFQLAGDALGQTWANITTGFVAFWNGVATIANKAMTGIVGGIQSFINGIIAGVERALNALAKLGGGGGVSLPRVSIPVPQIPMIAAADGFSGIVTRPTTFLAGEAGPESVNITPSRGGHRAGGDTYVHIEVHGSLLRERDIGRIADEYHVAGLRKRGFHTL